MGIQQRLAAWCAADQHLRVWCSKDMAGVPLQMQGSNGRKNKESSNANSSNAGASSASCDSLSTCSAVSTTATSSSSRSDCCATQAQTVGFLEELHYFLHDLNATRDKLQSTLEPTLELALTRYHATGASTTITDATSHQSLSPNMAHQQQQQGALILMRKAFPQMKQLRQLTTLQVQVTEEYMLVLEKLEDATTTTNGNTRHGPRSKRIASDATAGTGVQVELDLLHARDKFNAMYDLFQDLYNGNNKRRSSNNNNHHHHHVNDIKVAHDTADDDELLLLRVLQRLADDA